MRYSLHELIGIIDHSLLHPTMTDADLEAGCLVAMEYGTASVCIKPYYVERCAELLKGTDVAVCTVIGFPHGGAVTESKRYETQLACEQGATEIDMVINIGKALSGDWSYVDQDIKAVVDEAHKHNAITKVIFETDFVTKQQDIIMLCNICTKVGAEYVKTSTGYGFVKDSSGNYNYKGATEDNLILMRANCPPTVGVKAAGGVRGLDALIRCKDLGCGRVGATATADMVKEYKARAAAGESLEG